MKYRVVERDWDIGRRRYAVEMLIFAEHEGESWAWSIERFFDNVLDAQVYLSKIKKGPREITRVTI
jgi:hypothetical protein